ncbi:pyruvate dehydrogenase [Pseudomonas sp. 21LCFQ02]|uniref:transketolase-like TK C-terminal-containing protein n=1 Tax=Pseudomonas sp. 21LCFQ02 TaxID=2957505 RepID=UPI00209AC038|nr:pyruvate dehydrogenase [Pseudomonas sp. 21LCFQ02]MCO8170055.1 pyruvate dehydrogenase [Pseudomonas sp. 21LCFQ02]
MWFREQVGQAQPLFYLTQSPTSAHLSMLSQQIGERGIVLNDLESSPSRWAKGAHPWLPLWLAGNRQCLPFDPACGEEALAIVAGALQSLYVDAQQGFCYLTLHDEPGDGTVCDWSQAWLGMYPLGRGQSSNASMRLLGAGQMLGEVRAAAQSLAQDWGVSCEVWSCPSYTRLARDAEAARTWNRRHADQRARGCHLLDCLGRGDEPVLAVTGYAEFVAGQIGAHLEAPFRALGADSLAADQRLDRHWVVYSALQMLVSTGQLERGCLDEALRHYRLV